MSDEEYTPTTEDVRDKYAEDGVGGYLYDEYAASFGRWLESVKAEAWDEGAEQASRFHEGEQGHWENDKPRKGMRSWVFEPAPANPYRAGDQK